MGALYREIERTRPRDARGNQHANRSQSRRHAKISGRLDRLRAGVWVHVTEIPAMLIAKRADHEPRFDTVLKLTDPKPGQIGAFDGIPVFLKPARRSGVANSTDIAQVAS